MKYFLAIAAAMLPLLGFAAENREYVILLHGLCRTSRSMIPLEKALRQAGFKVLSPDYPSRSAPIEKLSESALGQAVEDCQRADAVRIHFVTHSNGRRLSVLRGLLPIQWE